MKKITILTCMMTLVGCSSPSYNYFPQATTSKTPPINTVSTSYIGEEMMSSGRYQNFDAIYIPKNIKTRGEISLTEGKHLKIGDDETGTYYSIQSDKGENLNPDIVLIGGKSLYVSYKAPNEVCIIVGIYNNKLCAFSPLVKQTTSKVYTQDSFQQTLLYNGKIGSKINISYREFSDDIARGAFTNNVEYDLSTSYIIGYRGAKIEVIEANNEMIKYKVINYFR